MTTTITRISLRVQRRWQRMFTPGDILMLILLTALMIMPILSLNAASWPLDLRTITPITLISIGLGFILTRSHYDEIFALILMSLYGIFTVFLVAAANEPGDLSEGATSVIIRTANWAIAILSNGINQDDLVFTLLMSMLFWYLGFSSIWHTFRINRLWRVIMPPGVILIANMFFYNGDTPLDGYLMVFMFVAIVLVARSNLDAREWDWYTSGIRVPRRMRQQFIYMGAALALMSVVVGWGIPSGDIQQRLDAFNEFMQTDLMKKMGEIFEVVFPPIESAGPLTTDYYGSDTLNLGGAIRLGEQIVMMVQPDYLGYRYYWRSRVFEHYDQGRWAPSADIRATDQNPPIDVHMDQTLIGPRREVNQIFTMTMRSRLFYAAPQPLRIDRSGKIDLNYTDANESDPQLMNISVIRPIQVIERGDSYSATSLASTATAHELRAAGTNYPEWIINPNTRTGYVSPRVVELANQIVAEYNVTNPYDKAKAIEHWLRHNIAYNETIAGAPVGVDSLEWFLFDVKEGYCTYYSTAMIVMLRSIGIPARMAAGFAQGDWDGSQYIVRERDAHTWVEVFFPGYGWIEFEPTAAQLPIPRDGDLPFDTTEEPVNNEQQLLPTPSPTATFTPQPSPTSASDDVGAQHMTQVPTLTLTPSPTPTATAVIRPTVMPSTAPPPDDNSILPLLLSIIGLLLLGILVIVIITAIVVFIWWWWEWRGMRGLSPISRAYARLERYVHLIGIRPREQQTPIEKRDTIVKKLPAADRPVTAITHLYNAERYGAQKSNMRDATADKAWPDARGSILKRWIKRFIPFMRED